MTYMNKETDGLKFGVYRSIELIHPGHSSVFNPGNVVGKPTGMEYRILEDMIALNYVNEDKFTLLGLNSNSMKIEDVTYLKRLFDDMPEHRLDYLTTVLEGVEKATFYRIVDKTNNGIGFRIIVLNGETYIWKDSINTMDKIVLIEED